MYRQLCYSYFFGEVLALDHLIIAGKCSMETKQALQRLMFICRTYFVTATVNTLSFNIAVSLRQTI